MTKECDYYRDLFNPYIKDEIGADARRDLAGHLASCHDCASAFGNEWRANVDEGKPRIPTTPKGTPSRFSFPKGRLRVHLLILAAIAILFFFSTKMRNAGSVPGGLEEEAVLLLKSQKGLNDELVATRAGLIEETIELVKSQRVLNQAMISLRRKSSPISMPLAEKFNVLSKLETIRIVLAKAKGKPMTAAGMAELFDPDFFMEASLPGGGMTKISMEEIWKMPDLLTQLIPESARLKWWSYEGETMSLWLAGAESIEPLFFILRRRMEGKTDTPGAWRLFYVNYVERN